MLTFWQPCRVPGPQTLRQRRHLKVVFFFQSIQLTVSRSSRQKRFISTWPQKSHSDFKPISIVGVYRWRLDIIPLVVRLIGASWTRRGNYYMLWTRCYLIPFWWQWDYIHAESSQRCPTKFLAQDFIISAGKGQDKWQNLQAEETNAQRCHQLTSNFKDFLKMKHVRKVIVIL